VICGLAAESLGLDPERVAAGLFNGVRTTTPVTGLVRA
jgi:hypothetical protein